jgi:hypothetical protein
MSTHGLGTVLQIRRKIEADRVLLLAGEEALLAQLPPGRWVGGTSAHFMTETGGMTTRTHIFFTDITEHAESVDIHHLDREEIRLVGTKYPANGFAVAIVPGLSPFVAGFALEVQEYPGIFDAPLIGWVSGVHTADIGRKAPKTFAGGPCGADDRAAVMYVSLARDVVAHLNILNLFTPDKGPAIVFPEAGFTAAGECQIDGKPANLARYLAEHKIDTRMPLVSDQNGAMVNVSILSVDARRETVRFFAPVFPTMVYRFAKPVPEYSAAFDTACAELDMANTVCSCNCILNFLYAGLEGKSSGKFVGPMTFGEIAYTLLNQTLAYLSVTKIDAVEEMAGHPFGERYAETMLAVR